MIIVIYLVVLKLDVVQKFTIYRFYFLAGKASFSLKFRIFSAFKFDFPCADRSKSVSLKSLLQIWQSIQPCSCELSATATPFTSIVLEEKVIDAKLKLA